MRKYSGMMAFVDLLFNLLLGVTVLFILSFLLINPPDAIGQIDPPVKLMVTLEWDDNITTDIDLWVRGYDENWVGWRRLDGNYFTLERDDLGIFNDTITVNGKRVPIFRNYEVTNFTVLPPGEYFINVHYFSRSGGPVEVTVNVVSISPFKQLFNGKATLTPNGEITMVSFIVDDEGKIKEMRTDIQMPYASDIVNASSTGGMDNQW